MIKHVPVVLHLWAGTCLLLRVHPIIWDTAINWKGRCLLIKVVWEPVHLILMFCPLEFSNFTIFDHNFFFFGNFERVNIIKASVGFKPILEMWIECKVLWKKIFRGGGLCKGGFFFFLENVKRYLHSSGGLNQTLEHVSAISALIDNENNLNKLNVTSISDLQINSHYKDISW